MDHTELLLQHCPEAVVEYVMAADPSHVTLTMWPDNQYFGDQYDAACRHAVLGYYSQGIGTRSSAEWDTAYVRQVLAFAGDAPPAVMGDIEQALRRLALPGKPLPGFFFPTLTQFNLDMRPELAARYQHPPAPEMIGTDPELAAYALYLGLYQEPGSLERLDRGIALIKGPSRTLDMLNALYQWKIPGAERIYEKYKDDGRQTSDVNGKPGLAVMDWARLFLGLPRSNGRRMHVDENGLPVSSDPAPQGKPGLGGHVPR